jgi:hypothetical protein
VRELRKQVRDLKRLLAEKTLEVREEFIELYYNKKRLHSLTPSPDPTLLEESTG